MTTKKPASTATQIDDAPMTKEEFLEERKSLIDGEAKSIDHFDRAMVALSAGSLAVSIAFVKDIAQSPHDLHWLAVGYIGFGIALVSSLFSFLAGVEAFRKQRTLLGRYYRREITLEEAQNRYTTAVDVSNYVSLCAFIVGVLGIAAFVWLNLG